jgi:hypothetical protein
VHAEGRKDEKLVGAERVQAVLNTHVFPAVDMDIELEIVMAVELRDLKSLIKIVVGFITLVSGLPHGQERRLRHLSVDQLSHSKASCEGSRGKRAYEISNKRGYEK